MNRTMKTQPRKQMNQSRPTRHFMKIAVGILIVISLLEVLLVEFMTLMPIIAKNQHSID